MSKNTSHSSYWMNDEIWDDEDDKKYSKEEASLHKITRLASTRRAIANFVNILTSRNDIEVKFSSGKDSYTTGDVVVIAAEDDPDKFDVMVGLALHEGAHVLLSDFEILKRINDTRRILLHSQDHLWGNVQHPADSPTICQRILHPSLVKMLPNLPPRIIDPITKAVTEPVEYMEYRVKARAFLADLMDIMNILEDRRIDQFVYRNAGGYRPYYDALYEKYFLNKEIGNNLKWNPKWRELTVENYINRLLFMIHPDQKPTDMPGLPHLMKLVDLATIDRVAPDGAYSLNPQYDTMPTLWKVANEIYAYILRFAALAIKNEMKVNENATPEASRIGAGEMPVDQVLENTSDLPNLDMSPEDFVPQQVAPADKTKSGKDKPTKFNEKRGEKAKKDAKSVLQNDVKKKKASKQEITSIDALEKADARMIDIKGDGIPGGQCMVTRRMNEKMLKEDWFIFGRQNLYNAKAREATLAAGRRMGAILEHRLQVRNDPVMTKFTRLPQGNIDRRLLANLGMDIENVFHKSRIDTFKPAMLHLTLDASGSMNGRKWEKVMVVATALAYVGAKVRNIDTVITVRGGNDIPMVSVVFDSRRDKFPQWMKWARHLDPNGATPEGLCYKATMGLILEAANTHDVYFINFSDGEPGFHLKTTSGKASRRRAWMYGSSSGYCNYGGELAINHTRAQINTIKEHGVKVLSYFIADSANNPYYRTIGENSLKVFRRMYGEDAVAVNVENASEVLRTLNKLLLERV